MISIDRNLCINCGRCTESCPMGIFRRNEVDVTEVGPQKRCIQCMHCTAACPKQAVRFEDVSTEALYPEPAQDELIRLIQTRRSIRHFRPEVPTSKVIQTALEAAAYAPSAKNQRVCRWTVLYGKERTEKAAELGLQWALENRVDPALVAMARGGINLVTCGAPCVIVCHAPRKADAETDGAIAMTTLELALARAGFGTCWAGYFARLSEAAPELRAFLEFPEEDEVLCALMVGYSDGDYYPNLPRRTAVQTNWID